MADKSISELVAATSVGSTDLFVLEQANTAKKLTGQILENWLVSFADGHGGIQSWSYTPPVAPSLEGTLTLTLADTTVITVPIMNGAQGATGAQTYVWIRWAAQEPTADNQLSTTPDAWIGIYVGLSATAPTTRGSYAWYQYKGAQGDQGDQGESIATVIRTGGDGSPGSTDTYTITLTDGTVAGTFTVYNGLNGTGAVASVAGILPDGSGNVELTGPDIGVSPSGSTPLADQSGGAIGSATDYARADHRHPMNVSQATPAPLGTAAPGTSGQYARADHVHAMPSADQVGAMSKWELLWENASPTSAYGEQTVSLDLSGYQMIAIVLNRGTGDATKNTTLVFVGSSSKCIVYQVANGLYPASRNATVSTTGVAFSSGFENGNSTAAGVSNSVAIPYQIYGIKGVNS